MNNNYQNNSQPNSCQASEPSKGSGIASMILGLLSIYFGFIPGIILACIARKKAREILDVDPNCSAAKFAKVGRKTGKIGLIISIITTVLLPIIYIGYIAYYVLWFLILLI